MSRKAQLYLLCKFTPKRKDLRKGEIVAVFSRRRRLDACIRNMMNHLKCSSGEFTKRYYSVKSDYDAPDLLINEKDPEFLMIDGEEIKIWPDPT